MSTLLNCLPYLLWFAALACALQAGIFFAFSNFVMRALAKIPAAAGIAAMQAINVTVINPFFMLLFMGAAGVSMLLLGLAIVQPIALNAHYAIAAAVCNLLGNFLVTVAGNVPLNNHLATLNPNEAGVQRSWQHFLTRWTQFNHLRTAASLLAACLFVMAIIV
jgi:uncharacterized membrane protein